MNYSRRRFCEIALLGTLAASAPGLAEPFPSLKPQLKPTLKGDRLHMQLFLQNLGTKPISVLERVGQRNAIEIAVELQTAEGSVALERLLEERPASQRPMTRAGPRRFWKPIPAREKLFFGEFVHQMPASSQAKTAVVRITCQGEHGPLILPPQSVSLDT